MAKPGGRKKKHLKDVQQRLAITEHCHKEDHKIGFSQLKATVREKNFMNRRTREGIAIMQHTTFNRNESLRIDKVLEIFFSGCSLFSFPSFALLSSGVSYAQCEWFLICLLCVPHFTIHSLCFRLTKGRKRVFLSIKLFKRISLKHGDKKR